MHLYNQYHPGPLLNNYVECFWELRSIEKPFDSLQRLIPGGRIELVFNFGTPLHWLATPNDQGVSTVLAHVLGQRDKLYFANTQGNVNLLGIRFKPGGINAFTELPASAFLNQMVPAIHVFSNSLDECESRLCEVEDTMEKISIIRGMLIKSIKPTGMDWNWVQAAVEKIRSSNQPISIREFCDEKGHYIKRLERAFLKYVGYSPKYYSRIIRFNKALRQMAMQQKSLTHIAADCNYYDQSHFIKDFIQFSGTTPKQFHIQPNTIADLLVRNQRI